MKNLLSKFSISNIGLLSFSHGLVRTTLRLLSLSTNIAKVSPSTIFSLSIIALGIGTIRVGLMPGLAVRILT